MELKLSEHESNSVTELLNISPERVKFLDEYIYNLQQKKIPARGMLESLNALDPSPTLEEWGLIFFHQGIRGERMRVRQIMEQNINDEFKKR